jgi:hypothetical protein
MHRALTTRRHTRWISLAAVLLFYPMAVSAAAQSLPGWGPYSFGKTPSELMTETKRVLLPGKGGPDLLDTARINGQLYTVGLYFRGANPLGQKLWKIQLHAAELAKMDQARCREFFAKIAEELKKKYGEMEGNAAKVPLAQAAASSRKFDDGSTLMISETFLGGCDVNITYEAPPLQPIEGQGF